jgi:hypothetical protein
LAIEVRGQRGSQWFRPVHRRYEPVDGRLRERTGPAVAAAWMAGGAALSPDELAGQALATEGVQTAVRFAFAQTGPGRTGLAWRPG